MGKQWKKWQTLFFFIHNAFSKNLCLLLYPSSYWWHFNTLIPNGYMWSTGEGSGKPLGYFCLENPMNSMKRQKDRTLKDELPRSVGAQYVTGDQWSNYPRKNKGMEPKQKQHPVVDGTDDRSKVRCCKEQYCIRTSNVRSMNQGKLEVVNRRWQEGTLTF